MLVKCCTIFWIYWYCYINLGSFHLVSKLQLNYLYKTDSTLTFHQISSYSMSLRRKDKLTNIIGHVKWRILPPYYCLTVYALKFVGWYIYVACMYTQVLFIVIHIFECHCICIKNSALYLRHPSVSGSYSITFHHVVIWSCDNAIDFDLWKNVDVLLTHHFTFTTTHTGH